jgi:hypothetical protein
LNSNKKAALQARLADIAQWTSAMTRKGVTKMAIAQAMRWASGRPWLNSISNAGAPTKIAMMIRTAGRILPASRIVDRRP